MTGPVTAAEREAYWSAVETGDDQTAYRVASSCLERGVPLADTLHELVVGSQARVGELWAANDWTVAQEHAATAVSETVVTRIGAGLPAPDGPSVLVACAEREWHALPALVVTQVLRSRGVRAEFLGASASRDVVVARILDIGPRLVLISASVASSLPRVRRQLEAVRGTGTPVVVGGQAFGGDPARARRLGATAYAASPEDVVELLETLPRQVPAAAPLRGPAVAEARDIQAAADDVVRDVLAAAGTGAWGDPEGAPDHWGTVLSTFVPHMVDCVVGALLTDDPAVVEAERRWLDEVVTRRGGERASTRAVWETLAARLREFPEAVRVLG